MCVKNYLTGSSSTVPTGDIMVNKQKLSVIYQFCSITGITMSASIVIFIKYDNESTQHKHKRKRFYFNNIQATISAF